MKQKYKIYINESPLWLLPEGEDEDLPKSIIKAKYRGKPNSLLNYIDLLEKSKRHDGVVIVAENHKKLYKDFKSLFTFIKAGGGVVRNKSGKVLIMHRLGYWDLPKGKMDPGETIEVTAMREVTEEVGLHELELEYKVCETLHCYRTKSKRVLKKTNWYSMFTSNHKELALEYREHIEDAAWVDPKSFHKLKLKTYRSVEDTIRAYNAIYHKK